MERAPTLELLYRWNPTSLISPHKLSSSMQEPQGYPKFFCLPPELRLLVYMFYFSDGDVIIAPKAHPHSRYATVLLLASHQLHDEAKPIMLRHAVLTIDLHPLYARQPVWDFTQYLDHHLILDRHRIIGGETFDGDIASPSGPFFNTTHYQHALPIYLSTIRAILATTSPTTLRISLNLGTLASYEPPTPAGGHTSLQSIADRLTQRNGGWRRAPSATLRARPPAAPDGGHVLRRDLCERCRERMCLVAFVNYLGELAWRMGAELRLESGDQQRRMTVVGDRVTDVLRLARTLDGDEDGGGEVWLVAEKRR